MTVNPEPCNCLDRLENVLRGLKAGELTGFAITTMTLKNGLEGYESFTHELTDAQILTATMQFITKTRDRLEEKPPPPEIDV